MATTWYNYQIPHVDSLYPKPYPNPSNRNALTKTVFTTSSDANGQDPVHTRDTLQKTHQHCNYGNKSTYTWKILETCLHLQKNHRPTPRRVCCGHRCRAAVSSKFLQHISTFRPVPGRSCGSRQVTRLCPHPASSSCKRSSSAPSLTRRDPPDRAL